MLQQFLGNYYMFCWAAELDIRSLVVAAQMYALKKAENLLS